MNRRTDIDRLSGQETPGRLHTSAEAIMKTAYGLLAGLLIMGAIGGSRLNLKQIADGRGLPKRPAAAKAHIVGMFVAPAICGAAGVWLGYLALRPKKESRPKPGDEI